MKHSIAVVYHSAFGHTKKVAEAVHQGAANTEGCSAHLLAVDTIDDASWEILNQADAIIFGAPTYMGSVSAPFKQFMDNSSTIWLGQGWKDKIAGGFTNSGCYSGDKLNSLVQLGIFAMQHGMIWVGTGLVNENSSNGGDPLPEDINRLGSFFGVATFAREDSPKVTPPIGDLKTAALYGKRIANVTQQFKRKS